VGPHLGVIAALLVDQGLGSDGQGNDGTSPEQPGLTRRRRRHIVSPRMKTRLVQIGNSRGVRLPKPLIKQAGLTDEVELRVRGNTVIIVARKAPRAGWAEAARRLSASGGDRLLDDPGPTHFDETDWQW